MRAVRGKGQALGTVQCVKAKLVRLADRINERVERIGLDPIPTIHLERAFEGQGCVGFVLCHSGVLPEFIQESMLVFIGRFH